MDATSIPATFGSLVAFLFFLAPGVLWNQLRHNWKAPAERSAFQEIAVVALFGTAFSSVAVAIVAAVGELINGSYYSRLERLIDGGISASKTGITLPALFAAAELVTAGVLVVLVFLTTRQRFYGSEKLQRTAWEKVLEDDRPENSQIFGVVKLADGSEVRGQVIAHSLAGPIEDRHLILGPPLAVRFDPTAAAPPLPLPYERLVLPAQDVKNLAIIYAV